MKYVTNDSTVQNTKTFILLEIVFNTIYYDDVNNGRSQDLQENILHFVSKKYSNMPKYTRFDAEEMKQITPGYYDDVITDGLKPDRETGVTLLFYRSIKYTFKSKYYSIYKIDISNLF